MKIYTKTGDSGESSLFGGTRVSKAHWRLEVYGTLDELNCHLGKALSELDYTELQAQSPSDLINQLIKCQETLFTIGSHLASENEKAKSYLPPFQESLILELEQAMDKMNEELPALKSFILPSGHLAACSLHICRTITRRAERRLVAHNQVAELNPSLLRYLNRLSDYFFVASRYINHIAKMRETPWVAQ